MSGLTALHENGMAADFGFAQFRHDARFVSRVWPGATATTDVPLSFGATSAIGAINNAGVTVRRTDQELIDLNAAAGGA